MNPGHRRCVSMSERITSLTGNYEYYWPPPSPFHTYTGSWANGLRSGYGEMKYTSGDFYKGYFENDQLCGSGDYYWLDGDHYSGLWDKNKMQGYGIFKYSNGDKFKGNFQEDDYHGLGELFYIEGHRYIGNWENGVREGQGKMVNSDGSFYEGSWEGDCKSGDGVYESGDGDVFRGVWREDRLTGEGEYRLGGGERYAGGFLEGERDGYGVMVWPNLNEYKGGWEKDMMCGEGELSCSNGNTYRGKWADNLLGGEGEFVQVGVFRYNGGFRKTMRDGYGEMTCKNGTKFKGHWRNDRMSGEGELICKNNDSYVGEWKDNILVQGQYISGDSQMRVIDGIVQDEDGCDTDTFIMYFERTPIKKVDPWSSDASTTINYSNDPEWMTGNYSFYNNAEDETCDSTANHTHNLNNIEDYKIDNLITNHRKEVAEKNRQERGKFSPKSINIIPLPSPKPSPIKGVSNMIREVTGESEVDSSDEEPDFNSYKDSITTFSPTKNLNDQINFMHQKQDPINRQLFTDNNNDMFKCKEGPAKEDNFENLMNSDLVQEFADFSIIEVEGESKGLFISGVEGDGSLGL